MAGKLKFDCKSCSSRPELKVERGCETDAPIPVLEITCVECEGQKEDCRICKGSGMEEIYRCPVKMVTPDVLRFFRYFGFYKQGYLPSAGGMLDQTVHFVEALALVNKELAQAQVKE